jgi:hypothetical protein
MSQNRCIGLRIIGKYPREINIPFKHPDFSIRKGPSTLLVLVLARLVLVLARLVLVERLVWLLLVLVNRRPHYFSYSPGEPL